MNPDSKRAIGLDRRGEPSGQWDVNLTQRMQWVSDSEILSENDKVAFQLSGELSSKDRVSVYRLGPFGGLQSRCLLRIRWESIVSIVAEVMKALDSRCAFLAIPVVSCLE